MPINDVMYHISTWSNLNSSRKIWNNWNAYLSTDVAVVLLLLPSGTSKEERGFDILYLRLDRFNSFYDIKI